MIYIYKNAGYPNHSLGLPSRITFDFCKLAMLSSVFSLTSAVIQQENGSIRKSDLKLKDVQISIL